jgi:hypothetical protein
MQHKIEPYVAVSTMTSACSLQLEAKLAKQTLDIAEVDIVEVALSKPAEELSRVRDMEGTRHWR